MQAFFSEILKNLQNSINCVYIINVLYIRAGAFMKKSVQAILGISISLGIILVGTLIGLTIWANRPRGVRIEL